jgi:hypothetical protein
MFDFIKEFFSEVTPLFFGDSSIAKDISKKI